MNGALQTGWRITREGVAEPAEYPFTNLLTSGQCTITNSYWKERFIDLSFEFT